MSCNGCRVLRKGCREDCMLRQCLQWIESPESQAHATLFVAKFFGRAGLLSFISAVPIHQRPGLFQSLLFEACGRTLNPVGGAVGLLGTGNWHVCKLAVSTVLQGGELHPMPEFVAGNRSSSESDDASETVEVDFFRSRELESRSKTCNIRNACDNVGRSRTRRSDLDLRLTAAGLSEERQQPATPSRNSEESETTFESSLANCSVLGGERKLLRLFL